MPSRKIGVGMRRREFITIFGSATACWSLAAAAEDHSVSRRIGVLIPYAKGDKLTEAHIALVRDALQQRGWQDGSNLRIDYRWADAAAGGLQSAAKELVELKPDVILVRSTAATAALLRATRTIPIVFVVVSDPVGDGLVQSMPKPGGNVTGFTNVEASLGGKWLELLKEIAPQTTQVGIVYGKRTAPGGGNYYMRLIERSAPSFKLKSVPLP